MLRDHRSRNSRQHCVLESVFLPDMENLRPVPGVAGFPKARHTLDAHLVRLTLIAHIRNVTLLEAIATG